ERAVDVERHRSAPVDEPRVRDRTVHAGVTSAAFRQRPRGRESSSRRKCTRALPGARSARRLPESRSRLARSRTGDLMLLASLLTLSVLVVPAAAPATAPAGETHFAQDDFGEPPPPPPPGIDDDGFAAPPPPSLQDPPASRQNEGKKKRGA